MAAPKGNRYAAGGPGGGRPSAYQEKSAAQVVKDIFYNDIDKDAVLAKIASGKYSGFDVLRAKILQGNDRIFSETLRKLVPDMVDVTSGGGPLTLYWGGLRNDLEENDQPDTPLHAEASVPALPPDGETVESACLPQTGGQDGRCAEPLDT